MYATLICGERGLIFYKVSFYKQKNDSYGRT